MATVKVTVEQITWLFEHDAGLSSKCVWRHMVGVPEPSGWDRNAYPHDPADLGRIVRLLDRFPEWRTRMPEMAHHGPTWARLVERWDDLVDLYREETGGERDTPAPRCYALMTEIVGNRLGYAESPR